MTYTSDRLPAGLSLDEPSVISGTPTAAQSATNYTVTGEDQDRNSATATVTITIAAAPAASLSPATQTVNGTVGTAITATTAFTASNFASAVTYTSDRLPAGLSLDANGCDQWYANGGTIGYELHCDRRRSGP